jgi:hypothetical protein
VWAVEGSDLFFAVDRLIEVTNLIAYGIVKF